MIKTYVRTSMDGNQLMCNTCIMKLVNTICTYVRNVTMGIQETLRQNNLQNSNFLLLFIYITHFDGHFFLYIFHKKKIAQERTVQKQV